jgi:hypothetical protein
MSDPNLTARVNGVPYSWNSMAHFFAGFPKKGLKKAEWSEVRERELVVAGQQDGTPLGLTAGVYRVDGVKFSFLRDTWNDIAGDLTALGQGSYGDAEFNYMAQLFEPVGNATPAQTLISRLAVTKVTETAEQGTGVLMTDVEMMCGGVLIRTVNGNAMQLWSKIRSLL